MKTVIINLSAIAIIAGTSFFAGRTNFSQTETKSISGFDAPKLEQTAEFTSIRTEAILINGEIIPVITLPELTIEAKNPSSNCVSARIVDGKVMPYVSLPTLEIKG
jgi:hypothetical protein